MPEAMWLNNSLIQDVTLTLTGVNKNVNKNAATYFLPGNDICKFSLTNLIRIISAYKRVYCPTTEHSAIDED